MVAKKTTKKPAVKATVKATKKAVKATKPVKKVEVAKVENKCACGPECKCCCNKHCVVKQVITYNTIHCFKIYIRCSCYLNVFNPNLSTINI